MNSHVAFKVLDFLYLQGGCQPLELSDDIPLTKQSRCPADKSSLKTLCVFVGHEGQQKIRYGCCDACGYCGYIDRPTEKWMTEFYSTRWKSDESRFLTEDEIQKHRNDFSTQREEKLSRSKKFLDLVQSLPLDHDRYVCEIGSGMGDDLKLLNQSGNKKVVGTENSLRRAEIARRVHGVEILSRPFEEESVQSRLKKLSPLSLIFSRHVLEHVYEPDRVIKAAATLQKAGDFLLTVVPNGLSEASMTRLLFLPHLHSFSRDSLETMLAKNGYIVTHDVTNEQEIWLVGRKEASPLQTAPETQGYFGRIARELVNDLRPRFYRVPSSRRMWWEKNFGSTRQSLHFPNKTLDTFYFKVIQRLIYGKKPIKLHALLIEDSKPLISADESPLEIQFEGNIKLLYK